MNNQIESLLPYAIAGFPVLVLLIYFLFKIVLHNFIKRIDNIEDAYDKMKETTKREYDFLLTSLNESNTAQREEMKAQIHRLYDRIDDAKKETEDKYVSNKVLNSKLETIMAQLESIKQLVQHNSK